MAYREEYSRLREQLRQEQRPQRLPPARVAPPPPQRQGGGNQLAAVLLQTAAGIIQGGAKAAMQYGVQSALQEEEAGARATAAELRLDHEYLMERDRKAFAAWESKQDRWARETESEKDRSSREEQSDKNRAHDLRRDANKIVNDVMKGGFDQAYKLDQLEVAHGYKMEQLRLARKLRSSGKGGGKYVVGPKGEVFSVKGLKDRRDHNRKMVGLLKGTFGAKLFIEETTRLNNLIGSGTVYRSRDKALEAAGADAESHFPEVDMGVDPKAAAAAYVPPTKTVIPPTPDAAKSRVTQETGNLTRVRKDRKALKKELSEAGIAPGDQKYDTAMENADRNVKKAEGNLEDANIKLQNAESARESTIKKQQVIPTRAKTDPGSEESIKRRGKTDDAIERVYRSRLAAHKKDPAKNEAPTRAMFDELKRRGRNVPAPPATN